MSDCVDLQNRFASMQLNFDSLLSQKELLQRQMNAQNSISSLLEKSAQALVCGPDCQRQRMTDQLKQKYLDAQTNLQTAPINLETNRKNYYVYTEGLPYYNNMLEEELKQKAEHIASLITENFNEELASANTMNMYYKTDVVNSANTEELLDKTIEENIQLQEELDKQHMDILTNDRKTYYETDAYERLQLWHTFWWYAYYIIVAVFAISVFVSSSQVSIAIRIVLLVLLVFYPYYIAYITNILYNFVMTVYNSLPRSVYNSL